MPAVGVGMTDSEIADAVNYIRTNWGNSAPGNAATGTVGDIRAKTLTVLAGNSCPSVTQPKLAEALKDLGASLRPAKESVVEMIDRIDKALPGLRATGASDDDIVNATMSAFCTSSASDKSITAAQRAGMLGDLVGLVYGRLRAHGKQD
jgi:hypothetical protein